MVILPSYQKQTVLNITNKTSNETLGIKIQEQNIGNDTW